MTMYFYSASAWVDAIILLNHLGFSVLYNGYLRTLRNIKASSVVFMKEQTSDYKLINTLDSTKNCYK